MDKDQLFRRDNISYRVAQHCHGQQAAQVIARAFLYDCKWIADINKVDPVNTPADVHAFVYSPLEKCIESGLSVVAVDVEANDKVVGAFLNKAHEGKPYEPSERLFLQMCSTLIPLLAKKTPHPVNDSLSKVGEIAWGYNLGVDPNYAKRGIGHKLNELFVELARKQGYKYALSFLVSPWSSRITRNQGYQVLGQIDTREYEFNGIKPFVLSPDPQMVEVNVLDLAKDKS